MKQSFEKYLKGTPLTPDLYREMCMDHDLTFTFSDDAAYHSIGRSELNLIMEAGRKLTPAVAIPIWNEVVKERLMPDFQLMFLRHAPQEGSCAASIQRCRNERGI